MVSPISRSTTTYFKCSTSYLLLRYILGVDDSQNTVSTANPTLLSNTNLRFWDLGWRAGSGSLHGVERLMDGLQRVMMLCIRRYLW